MTEGYKKSIETKQKIIDATVKLLEEKGFENLTVRDICNETGLSLSRINYHFTSKDNLLYVIACQLPNKVFQELSSRIPHFLDPENTRDQLCFTLLFLKVLFSDAPCMEVYRKIYTMPLVADGIAHSSKNLFYRLLADKDIDDETLELYANAYSGCIVTLVRNADVKQTRTHMRRTIRAVGNFFMMLTKVDEAKQEDILTDATNLISEIEFKVTSLTTIEFYN